MFPFSTIILLANLNTTLPPTAMPGWSIDKFKRHEHNFGSISAINTSNDSEIKNINTPEEREVFAVINNVFSKLESFSGLEPGWDGDGSIVPSENDLDNAIEFVRSIPAVLTLPKAMLSGNGTVGLYWDDSIVYTDIQFESNKTISIFSRNRLSGEEIFIDSVNLDDINNDWYFDILNALLSPGRTQAAA
ncbi:MAG: hypothetical protein K2P74_06900 [Nitrosomonas sp.]|nr:hypothetical protein [Nitrosomonas sp.]